MAQAVLYPGWLSLSLIVLTLARWLNLARIARGRRSERYLRHMARITSLYLLVVYAALLFGVAHRYAVPQQQTVVWLVALVQLVVGMTVFISMLTGIRSSRPRPLKNYLSDHELPTVTVAVPARNETQDLADCLESLLASDYPKLEIVVLDDCSQDKTPEVIKSFAHDGVRFVQGEEPDAHWLAKNLAYQRLSEEATGKYILFCGVDVRLGRGAIRELVNQLLAANVQMASVLPVRVDAAAEAALIQPLRYWWELALPRRFVGRPPVLSTCWIIARDALESIGGFGSMSRAILPEAILAQQMQRRGQYHFWRTHDDLYVETHKSLGDQRDTAIRVRYPQLHQRMELAMGLLMFQALVLLGSLVLAIVAWATQHVLLAIVCSVAYGLLLLTHLAVTAVTNPYHTVYAIIAFPFALLTELLIGTVSMLKYEFSHVEWKDRDVSVPVMRVIPRLPQLK